MATSTRLGVVSALALACACHGGAGEPKVQEAVAQDASDAASGEAHASPLDPPLLDVVMLDPRLVGVDTADPSAAARAIAAAIADPKTDAAHVCTFSYVEGRMHSLAGENAEAAKAFDRAGGSPDDSICPLAPYARLRSAQAWLKTGTPGAAPRAKLVPDDIALADEAKLALADASSQAGDPAAAETLWQAYLAAHPKGARWIEVAGKLGQAIVAASPKDGYELATRIIVEAPAFETSAGAIGTRAKALGADQSLSGNLTPEQRQKRAQAWLDSGHADRAFIESSGLFLQLGKGKDKDLACKIATTRAQASAKTKASTADAWEDAAGVCESDALATALYNAGKARASKSPDVAAAHFAKLEQLFPQNKLADDARLRGALAEKDRGNDALSMQMLEKLPDDYPAGDMKSEALFRVALAHMQKGDWDGAVPSLDRALPDGENDRHWATSGRALYFRGRAYSKKGDVEGAKKAYAAIVANRPLSFFMLLAYARLEELDAALAKKTMADAEAKEPEGAWLAKERPELASPAFVRALRLLEVGETDAAKREMVSAAVLGDSADPELVWLAATLFDRASAPEIGHAFSRARVQDHLSHYPRGRWRVAWEAAFPRAFDALVVANADAQKTPRALVWGIMREESAFYPEATSPSAAFGLMQLIASTAKQTAQGTSLPYDEASLKKPPTSIALGAKLLGSLRAGYPQNPTLSIPAYNGGVGAVGKWVATRGGEDFDLWVEEIPFEETRGYIKRVLASVAAYAYLYDAASLPEVLHLPLIADGRKP